MMDDVVGLVMVQVISNLGGDNFSWVTVVRPVLVSAAFAVITPVACLFIVEPLTLWLNHYRKTRPLVGFNNLLRNTKTAFVIHTLLLIGLVTGANFAGTSNLFAAYIAGATISWWDSEVPHPIAEAKAPKTAGEEKDEVVQNAPSSPVIRSDNNVEMIGGMHPHGTDEDTTAAQPARATGGRGHIDEICGSAIYERYYHPAVSRILQPLFFASIGFSIPITRMFRGTIVWRGIIYTMLMATGKFVCGLWLVRFSKSAGSSKGTMSRLLSKMRLPSVPHLWGRSKDVTTSTREGAPNSASTEATLSNDSNRLSSANPPKPYSLHPPFILALAMCARGEIGFLISGVAESNGIFSASGETSREPSDIFLVVTWAIVLCTILGPLGVGLSVRRVKKLQERKNRQQEGAGRDVLGVWGVESKVVVR